MTLDTNAHDLPPLPTNWTWTTVSEIAYVVRGVTYEKAEARENPVLGFIPVLRANNIQDTGLVLEDELVFVPLNNVSEIQLLQQFDIVVCMSSGSKRLVGKTAQLKKDWQGSFGAFCASVRVHDHLDRQYIGYYFRSEEYRNYISRQALGVNINNLRQTDIETLRLPIPPLAEQKRIVEAIEAQFTRLDAGIDALKRLRANLKRYKAAVLKAACEGKLVPQDPNDEPASELLARILKQRREKWEAEQIKKYEAQGKNPPQGWREKYIEPAAPDTDDLPKLIEGWIWTRAEQICEFITKGTTPSPEKMSAGKGEVPYIKVYNLTFEGTLNFTVNPTFISKETHWRELGRSKVYPGDVLINIVGPPLGQVVIVPDTYPEWNINQAIARYRPIDGLDRRFLSFLLMSESVFSWALVRVKATAGQSNLTLEICRDLPLPLPPFFEQKRIADETERILSTINNLEIVIQDTLLRANRLRQSILKEAFVGRLVSQDPNDESASELLKRIHDERTQSRKNHKNE